MENLYFVFFLIQYNSQQKKSNHWFQKKFTRINFRRLRIYKIFVGIIFRESRISKNMRKKLSQIRQKTVKMQKFLLGNASSFKLVDSDRFLI